MKILNLYAGIGGNRNLFVNLTQRKALSDLINDTSKEEVIEIIKYAFITDGKDFCPKIISPLELQYKFSKIKKHKIDHKTYDRKEEFKGSNIIVNGYSAEEVAKMKKR